MQGQRRALLTLACLIVGGCDEPCENGYKIKKEYSTLFWDDSWHENSKDTILDGAVRTSTWTYKDARSIDVRCFQGHGADFLQYDIRYSINVPLLARLEPELQKAGAVELVISIDGGAAASVPARIIKQDSGIDFLGAVEPALIDKLEAAKDTIIVMPRQAEQKLDEAIEFKAARLAEYLAPVKKACVNIQKPLDPTPVDNEQQNKKASN